MWKILFAVLSVEFIYFNVCQSQSLTKDIKKCHFGDTTCLIKTINDIIQKYPRGIPALGMKPINVVDINNTELLNQADIGGIKFEFKMYDQVNYGFENTTITNLIGFGKDPTTEYMEIHGNIPSLIHKGKYLANGQILLLRLNATGESTSDFQNFHFVLKLKVQMEYRNNKRYLKIYELVPRVSLDRWIIWLEDFFPENSDLTTAVNKVINSNWVEFWNEVEPAILNVFTDVFTHLVGDIFQKTPYDDLFLADDDDSEEHTEIPIKS